MSNLAKKILKSIGIKKESMDKIIVILEEDEIPTSIVIDVDVVRPADGSTPYSSAGVIYGNLDERKIKVSVADELDPKYLHDIMLLEGEYDKLCKLEDNIKSLNLLYRYYNQEDPDEEILEAAKLLDKAYNNRRKPGNKNYIRGNIEHHGRTICRCLRTSELYEASKLLNSHGIKHLQHEIKVKSSGLYAGHNSKEIKIGNIDFELYTPEM